jgi:hypothetical protein
MKLLLYISLLFLSLLPLPIFAQEQQVVVPYTLSDRDRAIQTGSTMELKFESQQRQLDDIKALFLYVTWG